MKSGVPWSIRDIDDDLREAARAAARQSGVSVSEWLNDLIARQTTVSGSTPGSTHEDDSSEDAAIVAEAVQRLTHRIRAMDIKSRSAISGLQDRLDEIEKRLGAAASGRSSEQAQSLKGIASIVNELSREIDNVDETARSMVEGLRDRGGPNARMTGRDAGAGQVSDAIRNLDARIARMSGAIKPPPAAEPPAKLDTIKAQLEALLAPAPERRSDRVTALDATLRSLEAHIDEARSRISAATPRRPSVSMTPGDEHRMHSIEENLAEITARLGGQLGGQVPKAQSRNEFASTVAEISERQRTIDERADISAIANEQKRVTEIVGALRTEIATLAERIASASHSGADEHEAYFRLADRIDALAAELPVGRELLTAIRGDLDAVRALLDGGGLDRIGEGIEELLKRAPNGSELDLIAERIGELLKRAPENDRLDALGEEIAAIRQALDAAESPNAISRLEMRIVELARGMDAAFKRGSGTPLAEGADALVRLESRLDGIAARIDGFLGRAASTGALDDMQKRFATLLDRFDKSARRDPGGALDEIKREIAGIRDEIASRPPPKIDHLENQVAELARGLESVSHSASKGEALSELEAQVAHLAAELERSMPRTATLKQVEENLARLQGYLSGNREESIEAARMAAREAVREFAEPQGDSDLVSALKGDLENIRLAAGDADQRTQETLGSVHETLARVVDRLTRLEQEQKAGDSKPDAVREGAKATGAYGAGAPPPRVGSDAAHSTRAGDDDRLLEPGSGKPDIAALRELARSASEAQRDRTGDRKADFIAAARRAAQAAAQAATSEAEEEEEESDDRPGAFARLGQAIRNRKRPLLLAAAAIVLAISAVQFFGERGVRTFGVSPDLASVTSEVADPIEFISIPPETALNGPTTPTIPQVSEPALVAPPYEVKSAIAFAAPEDFGNRFGEAPAGPAATGFSSSSTGSASAAPDATIAAPGTPIAAEAMAAAPPPQSTAGPPKLGDAATAGDPAAAFELAARYAEGHGVNRDLAKAAEWYQRAADAGVAVAQYRLGSLYERGQGVAKDPTAAVTWYQRAADQGNVGAMHNLAVMMSEGVDGPPDHAKAFEWFLAAARCGVKDSQYNLGVIYARGLGPEQDLVESYKWFALAAAAGDADAATRRDEVGEAMSADDLAKARATVQAWRATPIISEANTVARPEGGWEASSDGLTEADRRLLVKKIQVLLAEKGYDPGPLDGFEGPQTRQAVRAFQRRSGIAETGQISGDLVTALVTPST
jgi:localization factor PodJL